MHPHIFASLHRYPGKWARTLDKGKDISMQDLLMHMEKMFGNKHDYDAMIRTLYEVQQKEDKTVEEYMLHIQDAVTVIHHAYPEHLPDHGRDLKKDHFYNGLHPYLHDALSFAMVNCLKQNRLAQCLIHCTPLQKSWRLGSWCGHTIMSLAQMLIETRPWMVSMCA